MKTNSTVIMQNEKKIEEIKGRRKGREREKGIKDWWKIYSRKNAPRNKQKIV